MLTDNVQVQLYFEAQNEGFPPVLRVSTQLEVVLNIPLHLLACSKRCLHACPPQSCGSLPLANVLTNSPSHTLTLVKILSTTPFSLSSVLISNMRACSASVGNFWGVSLFRIPCNLRYSSVVFWQSLQLIQGFSAFLSSTFCASMCVVYVRVCVMCVWCV